MNAQKKVVIIGGGISGLATAYRLCELSRQNRWPLEITLVEATSRLGGVIESQRRDGFLLEGGPDSFISEKPAACELSKRLGIVREIIGTNSKFRRSFIYKNEGRQNSPVLCKKGRLIPIPEGFYLIAPSQIKTFLRTPLLDWKTKFRMGCEILIPRRTGQGDESVANFVRRRFGETTLREVAQPMIGGIYTADPECLSLEATMPQFLELEQTYGSVIKGLFAKKKLRKEGTAQTASGPRYSLFLSFKEGMEELIRSIASNLPEVRFKLSSVATRVESTQGWDVSFQSGQPLKADAVCLALSAHQAAQLLSDAAPALVRDLKTIPYESVATVNLAYKRSDIPHRLDGFGFVVPMVARRKIVACSFSSVKFEGRAPQEMVLLRVFLGGALHREVYALDNESMECLAMDELRHYLGIKMPPIFSSIKRYPRTMPQYQVGHLNLIQSIRSQLAASPGLYLTGNAYRGIGVPDCIQWAELTAESIFMFLRETRVS